jgi:hypothetical protein
MKYGLLLLLFCWGAQRQLAAQSIHFEKDSLRQVFAQAKQQHKLVFVLLAPPPPPTNLPPHLKEERSKSGLNTPALAARLNQDYLSKELAFGKPESAATVRKYTVTSYPTYLYFNADGSLLYRSIGNSMEPARYLKDLDAVQQAQADPHNLSYFEAEYARGNRSASFLKQYLTKRRELNQIVEPALLDEYARQQPAQAFYQAPEVLFVLENGPVVGSPAFQLSHLSKRLVDSLYRVLPLPQRVAINNRIIHNTMAQAEATKNRDLASQGANFARSSWNNNYTRGAQSYESNMLTFYRSTKDTAAFLRQSVSFYERYYMNISPDSAKKAIAALQLFRQEQQANVQRLEKAAAQRHAHPAPTTPRTTTVRTVAVSRPPAGFLQELNNGAWAIYQTGTRTKDYLWHATMWSKRTVDLDPTAFNCDTLAHLLYRLGFYEEAEAREQQAATLAQQDNSTTTGYKQELEKMRKRTL